MRDIFEYKNSFSKYDDVKSLMQYGSTERCPDPVISVIMPMYRRPEFFIHSYLSVKNQKVDFDYEIIIIDDTPIDGEKSEALKYLEREKPDNVFYFRNEFNLGQAGNWNRGITLCRASLFTFCHDDDMLYPDCLSTLYSLHKIYPNRFIIPEFKMVDERAVYPFSDDRKVAPQLCMKYSKLDIFMDNPANGVGCLFYKDQMMSIGGYNNEYYPSHDNAIHILLVFKYGAIKYNRQLFCYRISNVNISNSVYKSNITNGVFYTQCMYPYIYLPRFVLKAMTHAYEANITETMERVWGRKNDYCSRRILSDRLVNLAFRLRAKIRRLILLYLHL